MSRVFIVRHGNTFDSGDVVTRVGARTDLLLSQSGQVQAEQLSNAFSECVFDGAFCSELQRTRQTARKILSHRTNAPALIILPFLTEIDYGPDENQPEQAVIGRIGQAALDAWDESATPPAGWIVDPNAIRKSWSEFFARAADLPGRANLLVVTSNGIARFVPDVVAPSPVRIDRKLKTGAYGIVNCTPGAAEIADWNVRP